MHSETIQSYALALYSLYVWGYLHTQTSYSEVVTWKIMGYFMVIYLKHWDQVHRPDTTYLQGPDPEECLFLKPRQPSYVWTTGSCSQPPCQSIPVRPPGQGSKIARSHPLRDEDVQVHKEPGLNWGESGWFLAVPKISLYPQIGQ